MFVCRVRIATLVIACVALGVPFVSGADYYYAANINELEFVEGKFPSRPREGWTRGIDWRRVEYMNPKVVLEIPGESYITGFEDFWIGSQPRGNPQLLVHTTVAKDVTGWIYWPKPDYSSFIKLKFVLPVS